MNQNEITFNPSLKANLLDSLQYLAEINVRVEQMKDNKITPEELLTFLNKRSEEFGYISDYRHTLKVQKQLISIKEGKQF